MDVSDFLERAGARGRESFGREHRLLDFASFLERVRDNPALLVRSGVQHLVDAVDHFGTREVPGVGGPVLRYRLFDAPWNDGRGAVYGQEGVQERLVRSLRTAAGEGRLDRLLLLHGPNGSSKSTLVETLMEGAARYSRTGEGVLYRFHWVFPRSGDGAALGFGSAGRGRDGNEDEVRSYALLKPHEVAARVPCEMRDNPLLLLPPESRAAFLEECGLRPGGGRSTRHLLDGGLCPKCRALYEALLAGAGGDVTRVLRHIQVERWYVTPRYREGAVVIPPQGSVDAGAREYSTSFSPAGLPPLLQHTPLVEASGDLVEANRGILEFSDFLKRPIDLFKYLLHATEKGTVATGPLLLHLDLVMVATTNELYLDAFKQSPDWTSFKARMELVEVPYLLEPVKERSIYERFAASLAPGRHLAPHVLDGLARFAVLTRLRRPAAEGYAPQDRSLVEGLRPEEKLRLYDTSQPPDRLDGEERRRLLSLLPDLRDEFRGQPDYEGRRGASAREIRSVLATAAADPDSEHCLAPRVVLHHLRELLRETTVHRFLRFEVDGGYHDASAFADLVEEWLARRRLEDIQEALQLVPEGGYERRLESYVTHVVAWTQKEKVRNTVTGDVEAPDEESMRSIEKLLNVRDAPAVFRSNLVARIGAFGLDHPGQRPEWRALFPEILRALREEYFAATREKVRRAHGHMRSLGTPDFASLSPEERESVERAHAALREKFGYCDSCAREAVEATASLLA